MDQILIAFLCLALSVLPVFAAPPSAGPGEMCGGFVGVLCKDGLRCAVPQGADAGICVPKDPPRAKRGEMCGGIAAVQCEEGLRCIIKDAHKCCDRAGICDGAPPQ